MNRILRKGMAENIAIEFDYQDSRGNVVRRVVKPLRFMGAHRFLGLCMLRETKQQFELSRVSNAKIWTA